MDISYLELINAIKKAKKEDEKANIWRRIFWNTPIEQEKREGGARMKAKKSNLKPCCVCGNEIYIPKNGKPTSCRYCHTVQRMAENGYDIIEMYTKRG